MRRAYAREVILERFVFGVGLLVLFSIIRYFSSDPYFGGGFFTWVPRLLIVWALLDVGLKYCLGAFAAVATILMVISTPIAVVSPVLVMLYVDLHAERFIPKFVLALTFLAAMWSVPICILSVIVTVWSIVRAQPYLAWSVAGFAKRFMHVLIGIKILPIIGAVALWWLAPVVDEHVHDGAFWSRITGIAWVVLSMPAILWNLCEGILGGVDRWSKGQRTHGQNVYGDDGFANPATAAAAMAKLGYE